MTGPRAYLDWNATAPLRPEAREAMLAAMDAVGNPSSVHAEGRAAKAIVERARGQVAALVGCAPSEVVFNSGASEGFATLARAASKVHCGTACHDAAFAWCNGTKLEPFNDDGYISWSVANPDEGELSILEIANGETGIVLEPFFHRNHRDELVYAETRDRRVKTEHAGRLALDATQWVGKLPFRFLEAQPHWLADYAVLSAHKLGGPKFCGALLAQAGREVEPLVRGGGQELRRRSGTENVIGIAGFGAAAEAALRDLENGARERVENLRNILESRLAGAAPDLQVVGKDSPRLPNTSCFAVRGWKGETQVMQMDLAGFAVSAGSACSSGKVGPSRVLRAMGYDEEMATSAIRVSIGPTTTEAEVMAFAEAWIEHYRRCERSAA